VVAPLLEARSLVRRYGGRTVVDVGHLHVDAGEVLAIVGPNGAGKSTLFRLLLALERPDAGEVLLEGEVATVPAAGGRMAGVFQRAVLFAGTVADNVSYGLRVLGVRRAERQARTREALRWFDLEPFAERHVHLLSGGEAQRVALARALVLEPQVLLLDEPSAHLDAAFRRRFRDDLEHVARQHARSIVLITHDPAEAVALADRVLVMHDGRVVQSGTPEEIVAEPGTPFVAALTGAELLLHGAVEAVEDNICAVRTSGDALLWAAWQGPSAAAAGQAAVVAYRPEDIALTASERVATSARNRLPVVVQSTSPSGGMVRVRLRTGGSDGTALVALLTRHSVEQLGVERGRTFVAHIKATALRAWRRDAWSGA
jgi:molybdopterin-binding protein